MASSVVSTSPKGVPLLSLPLIPNESYTFYGMGKPTETAAVHVPETASDPAIKNPISTSSFPIPLPR
jgi:hypothetical protein